MAVPANIDLRSELLTVRDQGETRPTCLAFAATSAHEYARKRTGYLCVEFLYFYANREPSSTSPLTGLTLDSVKVALRDQGQPTESFWPYDINDPTPMFPPSILGQIFRCAFETHNSPNDVVTSLRSGIPVVVGLEITQAWYSNLAPDYVIDEDKNLNRESPIGHAVLAIGIREDETGNTLILIQNSWGIRWAENGCAWLTMNYLDRHFVGCMIVGELL